MINNHVYICVLHYPAVNKEGRWVCTSFTTLDFHDIARPARTYELAAYYIVQPLEAQQFIIEQQLKYWTEGFGATFNPRRSMAGSMVRIASSLTEVIEQINKEKGVYPKLIATSAKIYPQTVSYSRMREIIDKREDVFLILLGTGWGMPSELVESCDYVLEPILGAGNYNHLSVRNAAAIIMDRLFSPNRCK